MAKIKSTAIAESTGKHLSKENGVYGSNRGYLEFMTKVMALGQNVDKRDVDDMMNRFMLYIKLCHEYDVKVGNQAAYAAMGITSRDVQRWESGAATPNHQKLVEYVKQQCALYREMLAQDGQIDRLVTLFWQKNYDGLKDEQEVTVSNRNLLGETQTAKQIAEKYKDLATD